MQCCHILKNRNFKNIIKIYNTVQGCQIYEPYVQLPKGFSYSHLNFS